jgi:hypothetical protein
MFPLVRPKRETVWRTSMAQASEAVKGIMVRGASNLTGAFLKASGQNVANAAAGTVNTVAGVGREAYRAGGRAVDGAGQHIGVARRTAVAATGSVTRASGQRFQAMHAAVFGVFRRKSKVAEDDEDPAEK